MEEMLLSILQALQQGQTQQGLNVQSLAASLAAAQQPTENTLRPREKLPKLSPFNGNRSKWDGWELEASNKLATDGPTIGDDMAQLRYIYACLEDEAQQLCIAWFQANQATSSGIGLIQHLHAIYADPDRKRRAMRNVTTMEQRSNEPFAKFLPKFETELAHAQAGDSNDDVKISWLERALNSSARASLRYIHPIPNSYTEYVKLHQTLSSRQEVLTKEEKRATRAGTSNNTAGGLSDTMDWEPTQISKVEVKQLATNRRRAKWVTQETMDYRKSHRLCLRCGKDGHIIKECGYLPAQRPTQLKTNIAKVTYKAAQAESDVEEDSGKE
jgi:hypothetical protein